MRGETVLRLEAKRRLRTSFSRDGIRNGNYPAAGEATIPIRASAAPWWTTACSARAPLAPARRAHRMRPRSVGDGCCNIVARSAQPSASTTVIMHALPPSATRRRARAACSWSSDDAGWRSTAATHAPRSRDSSTASTIAAGAEVPNGAAARIVQPAACSSIEFGCARIAVASCARALAATSSTNPPSSATAAHDLAQSRWRSSSAGAIAIRCTIAAADSGAGSWSRAGAMPPQRLAGLVCPLVTQDPAP